MAFEHWHVSLACAAVALLARPSCPSCTIAEFAAYGRIRHVTCVARQVEEYVSIAKTEWAVQTHVYACLAASRWSHSVHYPLYLECIIATVVGQPHITSLPQILHMYRQETERECTNLYVKNRQVFLASTCYSRPVLSMLQDGAPARRESDIALDALPPAKKTDAAWEFSRDKYVRHTPPHLHTLSSCATCHTN